jgi:hypothetical protein
MKKAIVNLSTLRYAKAQYRLSESLKGKTDADVLLYQSERLVGSPSHQENPYAFKIYAIEEALKKGYTKILWLDSSCYAVKDIQPVFDIIDKEGYFMEWSGHEAGKWTNDRTLEHFEITREEAFEIPMFSAGFTGLDFTNDKAIWFFRKWKQAMLDGMFNGEWTNKNKTESQDPRVEGHRHDLCVGSIIAHQLGMKFHSGENLFQYASPIDTPESESIVFYLQGI